MGDVTAPLFNTSTILSGVPSTKTYNNGFYTFSNLRAGDNYMVLVHIANYYFKLHSISVNDLNSDQVADFIGDEIPPYAQLSGKIVDSDSMPISGVTIELLIINTLSVKYYTTIGYNGYYIFQIYLQKRCT